MKKIKNEFVELIVENSVEICSSPILAGARECGFASEVELHNLLRQKYGAVCSYFMNFLYEGYSLADLAGLDLVADAFLENWREESGLDAKTGFPVLGTAHEDWRLRSLTALGIQAQSLADIEASAGTRVHNELVSEIIASSDVWLYVGALMQLEHFVILEMRSYIAGFEHPSSCTHEEFCKVHPYDTGVTPLNIHEYWYNHAVHDAEHFEWILEASLTSPGLVKNMDSVREGIQLIKRAKLAFYQQ